MGSVLKRFVAFFGLFLGVLGILVTARYPFLPESLASVYRVDKEEAIALSGALTATGLVACLFLVAWRFARNRNRRLKRIAAPMRWTAVGLLLACALALLANSLSVRTSTRMASAIEAARDREGSDLMARDLLVTIDDPSIELWQKYRAAIEFLNVTHVQELEPADILTVVPRAPLQDIVFLTYVLAICCLKLGCFATSSAICFMDHAAEHRKRPLSDPKASLRCTRRRLAISQAAHPPETKWNDALDIVYDATIPCDERFFESLNRVVQIEPWLQRDEAMIDQLKAIGIGKGKSLTPDAATKQLLKSATTEAHSWPEF